MRIALLSCGAVLLAAAVAGPAPGASGKRPIAKATLTECISEGATHRATFRGEMLRVRRARRMSMRFALQEKVAAQRFSRVALPGFGAWHFSRRRVPGFAYNQEVLALAPGATYRVVVSFRWHGRRGRVLKRTRRRSPGCAQPGELPNLVVGRIEASPREAGTARYSVHVRNDGSTVAESVPVALFVDQAEVDAIPVARIPPGEKRVVTFTGPACRLRIEGRVDPADLIRETSEADNSRSVPCPAAG